MKKKTLLIAVAAIVLAVVSACSVTLAWLTADSDEVTNTFTVGNITIELKEHEFANGELTTTEVATNNTYKVVPGATEKKDPFVKVKKGSEACYVYAKVVNNLVVNTAAEGQTAVYDEVATLNINSGWTLIGTSTTNGVTTYLYRYNDIVNALDPDATYTTDADGDTWIYTASVFSSVTYDGEEITTSNIAQLTDKTIVIDAYAHQSANLTNGQSTADTAALAWAGCTAIQPGN